ncbi:hypothetical protein E2562_026356 [Oryza meyeriana var. granulata]|uniref:Uncharacterized protein n=1 Tax=Oryza meyeriana var. granulata TaxID=110450 RepID=A0A6G1EYY6_9ORYZ|nr:hypothetical protein E2562_026356 [Oryza meyeriana var. granulata]
MDAFPHLLPLLLASWSFSLSDGSSALPPLHHVGPNAVDLHPIVLIPGNDCSQLDAELSEEYTPSTAAPPGCDARKGKGWFRLWKNSTALRYPDEAPCYADQLRVVYDRNRRDYHNVAGVRTHVVSFGTTRGFGPNPGDDDRDPSDPER